MTTPRKLPVYVAFVIATIVLADAAAQSGGGPYRIDPVAIAAGGGPVTGAGFQLSSTLGQTAASTLSGGQYRMFDGFWNPVGGAISDVIFRNGFDP